MNNQKTDRVDDALAFILKVIIGFIIVAAAFGICDMAHTITR